ncbi:MAG TPA: hypothetical protein VK540_25220 [Polyangiaceae bacterium]|nr:hypothetical protein [Polyangiaceae bacterium]
MNQGAEPGDPTPGPAIVHRMLDGNRMLFEENRRLGGTLYPFCALELSRGDWQQHYHEVWHTLIDAKHRYDPGNVFASGPSLVDDRTRLERAP